MLLMAGVAVRAGRDLLSRLGIRASEGEKSPPARKSRGVFGVNLNTHQVPRLKLAAVIDGAFSGRAPRFHDENRPFGPGAGLQELVIRHRVCEYIVEHGVARHVEQLVVTHVETG